jgi:hypothetical protein
MDDTSATSRQPVDHRDNSDAMLKLEASEQRTENSYNNGYVTRK